MRAILLATVALGLGGCASTDITRQMQTPAAAPPSRVLFPYENHLRDAVVLEWIGGMSQYSYILAEPNQSTFRPMLEAALRNSGLQAGTPVRARYGLRVEVEDVDGPDLGGSAEAHIRATYILVERATQSEIFRQTVETTGVSAFLAFHEGDLRQATQISSKTAKGLAVAGATLAGLEVLRDFDYTKEKDPAILGQGHKIGQQTVNFHEWSSAEWTEFWKVYRYAIVAGLVTGPVITGAQMANPLNYVPFASDDAARDYQPGDGINEFQKAGDGREARNASDRAARANYRAAKANIAGFLVALTETEGIKPIMVLPCYGDKAVEDLKQAAMVMGGGFRSDDCSIRRGERDFARW